MACEHCGIRKAIVLRPKNRMKVCKECFYELFENEIHDLIIKTGMFERGKRVGIGISGGKDSTVLAYVLNKLNVEHDYGIHLVLLCVDEGISGYRDRSIDTVNENQKILGLELEIISYQEIFGITMDQVVDKIGKKGNCTYCGIFRRQALEEAARRKNVDYIVTGHNADDLAETVLLNFFRGDVSRLKRCTLSKTKEHIMNDPKQLIDDKLGEGKYKEKRETTVSKFLSLARCKPFKYTYQKEIVFYAYFKKLPYFSTECTYAPNASRGDFRALIKDLEKIDSKIILNLIKSGEYFLDDSPSILSIRECKKCKHPTSSDDQVCIACGMINKLQNMKISKQCCTDDTIE